MFIIRRRVTPAVNATLITLSLLLLMYYLIHVEEPDLQRPKVTLIPPIHGPLEEDDQLRFAVAELIEVEPQPAIPAVQPKFVVIEPAESLGFNVYQPPKTRHLKLPENSALILKLGIAPTYPQPALRQSLEGYVLVGFSVDANGSVYAERVIESEPKGTFDRASLKAIAKFKYQPKMQDGKPVASHGHRYQFVYSLAE